MADTLKPWLHKTTSDYLNRHNFNLSFDIETSRLLQITEFHVEASNQQVWAKGHDKEIGVLIQLDKAAVADFNRSHVQSVTGYRGGLFRVLKVALRCSTDYPDVFRPAQSGSAKAEKLFLHVKAFEYYSSKGEASFVRSCRELTDSFGSWVKRYKKHRAKRNIDIVDGSLLGSEDVSMDLPPSMSQFTTDAGLAKLRHGTAGLAAASINARSVKTPPPPSPVIRITPKDQRTNRAIISDILRVANSTPRASSAKQAVAVELAVEEQAEVSNEIVTFDTSSAMPSTPEPPPTSTATTSLAASPVGWTESMQEADTSFNPKPYLPAALAGYEAVDKDATKAIDAEERQRQQPPAEDVTGLGSYQEGGEDTNIADIPDAEEIIRNASMEMHNHKPKKRTQLPRYELSSQASDLEPFETLPAPEAEPSSPQPRPQQTQTIDDNTTTEFVSAFETQTVAHIGVEEGRVAAAQDMHSAGDRLPSPRTAPSTLADPPVLPELYGESEVPAAAAGQLAPSVYHPAERQILAGQSSQDAIGPFVEDPHVAAIWNDQADDSFDFVSFAHEQHGDQQYVQVDYMLPKAESVVPEDPLDLSARAEGRLADLKRSVSQVSGELNDLLQEETQRLFQRGFLGTASPFCAVESDTIGNLVRQLLFDETESDEEQESDAKRPRESVEERAIRPSYKVTLPGASGAATTHREESLLFETSYSRQELDDLMQMDDNPTQQFQHAEEVGHDQHRDSYVQTGIYVKDYTTEQLSNVADEAPLAAATSTSTQRQMAPPESNRTSLRMSAFALLETEADSSPAGQVGSARTGPDEQVARAAVTASNDNTAPSLQKMLLSRFGLRLAGVSSELASPDDNSLQTMADQLSKPVSPRQPSIARSEVQAKQVVPPALPDHRPPRTAQKRKRSPRSSNIEVASTAKKAKTEFTKVRQEELKAEVAKGVRHRLMSVAPGLTAGEGLGLWYCCSGDWTAAATIARFNKTQADSDDDRDPSVLPEQVVAAFKSCWTPDDDKVALRKDSHRKSAQLGREAVERRRGVDSIAKRKTFLKENYVAAQMRHAQPIRYPYISS